MISTHIISIGYSILKSYNFSLFQECFFIPSLLFYSLTLLIIHLLLVIVRLIIHYIPSFFIFINVNRYIDFPYESRYYLEKSKSIIRNNGISFRFLTLKNIMQSRLSLWYWVYDEKNEKFHVHPTYILNIKGSSL